MQQATSATSSALPPRVAATARDIQRMALRDLVQLATESAATEAQIERQQQAAVDNARKELDRALWAIEQRHKSAVESLAADFSQRVAQTEAQYQSSLGALKAADAAARKRIQHDYDVTRQEVTQRYNQETWLAESVFDASQNQYREEAKASRSEQEAREKRVASLEQRALALLARYQYAPATGLPEALPTPPDNLAEFTGQCQNAERRLQELAALQLPKLFVGARWHAITVVLAILMGVVAQLLTNSTELNLAAIGVGVGATALVFTVLGLILGRISRRQIDEVYLPLHEALAIARHVSALQVKAEAETRESKLAMAVKKRDIEVQRAKDKAEPLLAQAEETRKTALARADAELAEQTALLERQRQQLLAELERLREQRADEIEQRREQEIAAARQKHQRQIDESRAKYDEARASLEKRLADGLRQIQAPMAGVRGGQRRAWNDPAWDNWTPPREFVSTVPLGEMRVDLKKIAQGVQQDQPLRLQLPEPFSVPVTLAFPRQASLLIQTDRSGREQGLRTMQMVMARLLTSLPAGRVRFTILDPVGLGQSFAGFMHLADHDDALVGGRIWTEAEHIEQRLTDLTEHMETVIQKYLRNEFETIDEYNAQAGELAEPYRFLVIADFPVGFEGDSVRRLASIVSSGARCGVYTLILRDTREPLPAGLHLEELESHALNLVYRQDRFVWKDAVFEQFPLTLDPAPDEELLTRLLDVVGRHAKVAKRVEVPFETIAPGPDQMWSRSSAEDITVPMGRMGATRLQTMRLGRGVAQHALIAGKTGSGKSTLLHVLVTNLALWYSPDEVEFYLVDFKKGVEFKTYATNALPHARAIAVESDREFGLSVLQRLDAELTRRGELYRQLGVQDLAAYRAATADDRAPAGKYPILPRTLLIIDEFQEFFSEDDKLAQDAGLLLDRLVRQGRAFGIHVLLGSQTIGGTSGLARSTIGQMAVRVALQCSEADSQLILGDANSAARLLTRPGEAIYNDAGGLVEANSPFQISWLSDDVRDQYLESVRRLAQERNVQRPDPIVFEGNAPASLARNRRLANILASTTWPKTAAPLAWLGEPVAIKDPTAVSFRRQSGASLIIVGQQEQPALAMMLSAIVSLAAQLSPGQAEFYLLDGAPADSPLHGVLPSVGEFLPHPMHVVEYRAVPEAIDRLAQEMQRRHEDVAAATAHPALFLCIYGLQRYRALRKQEESFSFSPGDEEKKPQPDKQFADLLREGPALGIHTIAWCDTPAAIERTLDRSSLREFDHRVLFQMSANDSSNLIDSPLANKLGFYRALAYSEEQGVMEKFRPYALPEKTWLEQVKQKLAARTG